MSLPAMAYGSGIGKYGQTQFGGYNHNLYAGDGEIWDMTNLTSDLAPLLAPRRPRYIYDTLASPNGLYANDGLYWVDGTGFYAGGEKRGTVTDSRKQFAGLGAYIIIMPDKAYYNKLTGEFGSLEASWSGAATIQDGTYAGESAEANTIYAAGADWASVFRVGDAVTIAGATVHESNNQTIIIREIDGDNLRFYANSFTIGEGGDSESALTISRDMPDLDFICANENRVWGCKGDEIYGSKLGDPFNWNVFDGVSTDSYAVSVGSAGDFTACCSYLGYPVFFKEEQIYKVYGDRPSNFQVMSSASLGVEAGSHMSLAIAGEVLFYLSRAGVVAYSGGIPQSIAAAFGTERYRNAVGGSDGLKYYVSMQAEDGTWSLFVYDTQRSMWHREDNTQAVGWAWDSELYCLNAAGVLWINGNARSVPEGATQEAAVQSVCEFGDFVDADPNKKGTVKFQVRIELDEGATVSFAIQFDSDGVWRPVDTLTANVKRSYILPIIPRRSDHYRIKITGTGNWRLYSLTRNEYIGSELKSTPGRQ